MNPFALWVLMLSAVPTSARERFHRMPPFSGSTASISSGSEQTTIKEEFTMTGEALDHDGLAVFHATFLSGDHDVGGLASR